MSAKVTAKTLSKGDYFGEMALMSSVEDEMPNKSYKSGRILCLQYETPTSSTVSLVPCHGDVNGITCLINKTMTGVRTATIQAMSSVKCVSINQGIFQSIFGKLESKLKPEAKNREEELRNILSTVVNYVGTIYEEGNHSHEIVGVLLTACLLSYHHRG
jgi:CRP-like cAMP-binding protein